MEAVRSLNALAVERGRDAIRAKDATSTVVEHLVRWLETRCDGDAAAALRAATEAWVENGGELSVPLVCAGEPPGPERGQQEPAHAEMMLSGSIILRAVQPEK